MAFRPSRALTLLPPTTIAAAVSNVLAGTTLDLLGMQVLTVQATFLYGSGGTTVTAYIQTTCDGGATWVDVMAVQFTTAAGVRINSVRVHTAVAANYTPTDGTLTANTIKDGVLGSGVRVKYTSVGTYAGATSLAVHAVVQGT